MPDDDRVVSDTSPLLNLALIDRLDLLTDQFPAIDVPEQVWRELTDGERRLRFGPLERELKGKPNR